MKRTLLTFAIVGIAACGGGETENPGPVTPPPSASAPASSASTTSATPTATTTPVEAPKPTLGEMHKKLGAQLTAAWMAHDAKKVTENYADGAIVGMPTMKGWEEVKATDVEKRLGVFFTAAPDVKMGATRVLIKNEVGVIEWVTSGTNTGDMMGEKGTGKKFGHHGVTVYWLDKASGKIARESMYMDEGTFMGQLGKGDKNAKVRAAEDAPSAAPESVVAKDGEDTSKNEAAVKAFYATFEKHDDKAYAAALTDDFTHFDYTRPADVKGKDAKKEFGDFGKTFPDLKINAKNVWGVGDYVVVEGEMSGTMKGALGPMKPTNKSATTHFLDVVKVKDGKIASVSTYANNLEFAVLYGLMKMPTPPAAKDAKPADAKPTDAKKDSKPADTKPAADPKKDPKK